MKFYPTVETLKNARGRILGYRARLAGLEADAGTKPEAVERLAEHLQQTIARLNAGTTIGQWLGHTYVVAPGLDGFQYWCDLFSSTSYRVGSTARSEALLSVLTTIAVSVWQHDWTREQDEALLDSIPEFRGGAIDQMNRLQLVRELRSRFEWLRRYRQATVLGHSETVAHEWAGGRLTTLPELVS